MRWIWSFMVVALLSCSSEELSIDRAETLDKLPGSDIQEIVDFDEFGKTNPPNPFRSNEIGTFRFIVNNCDTGQVVFRSRMEQCLEVQLDNSMVSECSSSVRREYFEKECVGMPWQPAETKAFIQGEFPVRCYYSDSKKTQAFARTFGSDSVVLIDGDYFSFVERRMKNETYEISIRVFDKNGVLVSQSQQAFRSMNFEAAVEDSPMRVRCYGG